MLSRLHRSGSPLVFLVQASALSDCNNCVPQDKSLPFPGKPWYSLCVSPIAKSLRDVVEHLAYTEDMCIPIFPNEAHPTGRAALHTEPVFPFSGCYLWTFAETGVRVAPRAEGWKPREAVLLPPIQRVEMNLLWDLDYEEVEAATEPKGNKKSAILRVVNF